MTDTATAPEPTAEGRPLARFGFHSVIEDHPEWRRLFGMDGWNDSPPPAESSNAEPTVTPGDYLDGREDEDDIDLPRDRPSIADLARDRLGIAAPDQKADDKFAAFSASFTEDPEGEGDRAQPDTTAVMPVAEAITTTTPAIAGDEHEGGTHDA